jgi:hypothetical protein
LAGLVIGARPAAGGGPPSAVDEYRLKAVFLFKFTKFVTWPASAHASPSSPFVIAVAGDDPFGSALDDAVRHEFVDLHPIVVRRHMSLGGVTDCHILFLSASEADRQKEALEQAKGRPTLVVADTSGAAEKGAMINLLVVQDHVKMEINRAAAEAAGLKLSADLLAIATIVKPPGVVPPAKP